jgi:hypothetical protein
MSQHTEPTAIENADLAEEEATSTESTWSNLISLEDKRKFKAARLNRQKVFLACEFLTQNSVPVNEPNIHALLQAHDIRVGRSDRFKYLGVWEKGDPNEQTSEIPAISGLVPPPFPQTPIPQTADRPDELLADKDRPQPHGGAGRQPRPRTRPDRPDSGDRHPQHRRGRRQSPLGRLLGRDRPSADGDPAVRTGANLFLLASAMATIISADTSFRYFRDELGITDLWERLAMFTVVEVVLVACGSAERAKVRRDPSARPGLPAFVAWAWCGVAAWMAFHLSGLNAGLTRVLLGPVLAVVMLHLALRAEAGARQRKSSVWSKVREEFRERLLSWIGLDNVGRTAAVRIQDRNMDRLLSLRTSRWPKRAVRKRRLRALRKSGAAHSPERMRYLMEQIAAEQHLETLFEQPYRSPWVMPDSAPRQTRETLSA